MLSLLSPWWLLGLGLLPPIRWLHRGGRHRRAVRVARLALWQGAAAALAAPGRRQPPDPAWRRRALLTALLFAALAGPQWVTPRTRITLWVDDSISMLARDAQGTRIAAGLAQVRALLASSPQAEVELRRLGDPWKALGLPDAAGAAALEREAGRQEPGPPPLALLSVGRQQWLLTDGADPSVLAWPGGRAPDRLLIVPGVTRNVGLQRLSARRDPATPDRIELLARVDNGGTAEETRTLVFASENREIARSDQHLAPGASAWVAVSMPRGARVRATLQPADALVEDDSLDLDLSSLQRRSVATDPRCPRSLRAAVQAHPGLSVVPLDSAGASAVLDCGTPRTGRALPTLAVHADELPVALHGPLQWSPAVAAPVPLPPGADGLPVAAQLVPRPGDAVLLAVAGTPVLVARAGPLPRLDTALDFAARTLDAGPTVPLLVNLMFERLLGPSLLDPVALVERGPAASRVAPVAPVATAEARAPEARSPVPDVRDLTQPLLWAAALVLAWEVVALGRQWARLRDRPRGGDRVNRAALRTLVALLLQAAAMAALAAALLGATWLDPRSQPRLLLLVDRSQSMPAAEVDRAVAGIVSSAQAAGMGDVRRIDFAAGPAVGGAAAPDGSATDIEAALDAALQAHAHAPLAGVVVVSDGYETRGDAARALAALRQARLPVHWLALGRAALPARIGELLAPAEVRAGQRLQLTVQVAGPATLSLRLTVRARSATGASRTLARDIAGAGPVTLDFDAGPAGALVLDVTLDDAASGRVLDERPDAALVDVLPPARLLYAQGSTGGVLAHSLQAGGWPVQLVPAARLAAQADALDGTQAVVLDDIAISDAPPRFWQALAAAVRERGLGLLVLGGERAFAAGGYRGSDLEGILPLLSEPAALAQPASVVFAVDKSGSMGQGSGGVDRFQLAQRAVRETARGLDRRDALGLIVFDAAPRVLLPLQPAADGVVALERDWAVRPNGGTRIAPALEAAITVLERGAAGRRLLVVVTDGFVDDAPLAALHARLAAAHIETLALAVGSDADTAMLQRLVGTDGGQVLRVEQAAELPLAMRSAMERQRARVERGAVAVVQARPLPFAPGSFGDWPQVDALPLTRVAPGATVAVESRRGDPLIAYHAAGLGRVLAVAPGLRAWTPHWLRWSHWPALAGGLADWIGAVGTAAGIEVTDERDAMRVDIDLPAGMGPPEIARLTLMADTPGRPSRPLALEAVAPGRLRARLTDPEPGLTTFVLSGPQGTLRQTHLRRRDSEAAHWGIAPALAAWKAAGWVQDWNPRRMLRDAPPRTAPQPLDRSLMLLALLLFGAGVAVDRVGVADHGSRPAAAALRQTVRRLRERAAAVLPA